VDLTPEVEAAAAGQVIAFGSLPPEGRDLDILVLDEELDLMSAELSQLGFDRRGRSFVRLSGCEAGVIELSPASSWGLPEGELHALYRQARPAPGLTKLCLPSAPHILLIVARRVARSGGGFDAKRRRRIDEVLDDDNEAWDKAAAAAAAWGAEAALVGLRAAYEQGQPSSRAQRADAIAQELRLREINAPRLRAHRTLAKRTKRGALISLSGLDGSGKSTQAEALRSTLERLGSETVVEWTKIARNPSLTTLSRIAKRILLRRRGRSQAPSRDATSPSDRPRSEREKSDVLTHAWAATVSVTNAWSHRRVTTAHMKHGRVVICDRYVLDTAAHLRYRYGIEHRFRAQTMLNRLISPKPLCSFLLEVSPEEALRRKEEQYDLEQLTLLASLYRSEAQQLGVTRLDGEKPREQLCEELARTVWERLSDR
jgi:thymidylate kinase